MRGQMQNQLRSLGRYLDTHAGKFLFVSLLAIATFSVGLKSATFHTNIEQLWAETQGEDVPSSEILSTHQMVVQTSVDPNTNILHQHGLLEHLELIKKATQVTVQVFDLSWSLKDVCQSPPPPNIDDNSNIQQIYEHIMPCTIVTPLDCFWEGSKLRGPDYPVKLP